MSLARRLDDVLSDVIGTPQGAAVDSLPAGLDELFDIAFECAAEAGLGPFDLPAITVGLEPVDAERLIRRLEALR